jgi:hypothetical protein
MTDKEYEKQKKRIQKLIRKWVKRLGLGWWKIDFNYHRELRNEPTNYNPNGEWNCPMATGSDFYYLTASVDVYLSVIKDVSDELLEECFLHEMMHIFLKPMSTGKTAKEEELVATKLARAFIWSQKD